MIELKNDSLQFSFPQVHRSATVSIDFQRTLRIPDDANEYPLPPGLGKFPLRHVDDFAANLPASWIDHGGVMLPMYQSEATWLYFHTGYDDDREASYPFAVKIAAGKINAVTGQTWTAGLHAKPQDYVVAPTQPWLDGFCVKKGTIRQFVAMPLGQGYTAEEQITDKAEHGGVQLVVYPMKRAAFEKRFPKVDRESMTVLSVRRSKTMYEACCAPAAPAQEMGLGAGGQMKQEIFDDPYRFEEWDTESAARCYVHIANSLTWRAITGQNPPTKPPTAKDYSKAGLPWFDFYSDAKAVDGSPILAGLKTVGTVWAGKHGQPLADNQPVAPQRVIELRKGLAKGQVREGTF